MGIAVVTGAGQGLGRATAERLARDGHEVVALDLDGDRAADTAAAVGGQGHACDVTDPDAVRAVAERVGGCDVLVNNAGIWKFHSILEMSPTDAQAVIDVNVLGVVWCTQAFAPLMVAGGGGSIVNLLVGRGVHQLPRARDVPGHEGRGRVAHPDHGPGARARRASGPTPSAPA